MGHRVLVVEDDEAVRESLMAILESEGFLVAGAANGRDALDVLGATHDVCVILLDLMMPVMDGWQFRAAQQQDPALASIPVVVVSVVAATAEQTGSVDAAAYVRKPVVFDELLALVHRICPTGSATSDPTA